MVRTKHDAVPDLPVKERSSVRERLAKPFEYGAGNSHDENGSDRNPHPMTANDRYLELWRVSKSYPKRDGGEAVIVTDFNLAVKQGEFVSLIGHSGCRWSRG